MSNNPPSSGNKSSCLLVGSITFIIIAVLGAITLLGGCYMCSNYLEKAQEMEAGSLKKLSKTTLIEGSFQDQIAVLYLNFVIGENIRQTETLLTEIHQAKEDESVKAIVLYINSPGGSVTASDVIYNAIKQAREVKPVIVYMDDIAASGGYYVACAANHIVANPNTLTGSIGVIISSINVSSAMEKIGVESQVYTSGDFKDMLSPTRKPRPEEEEYIKELIQETYSSFVQIVSTNRNIPVEKLKEAKAIDGRIISGRKALTLGLIDSNGYLENAISKAEELTKLDKGSATVFRYNRSNLNDLLELFLYEAKSDNKVKVELSPNPLPQLKPGIPYLLPSTYVNGSDK